MKYRSQDVKTAIDTEDCGAAAEMATEIPVPSLDAIIS